MADSTPSSLSVQGGILLEQILRLPAKERVALIEALAQRLSPNALEALVERLSAQNRARWKQIGQAQTHVHGWITKIDLLEFASDSWTLANDAWDSLLRHSLRDGMKIVTASGDLWNQWYADSRKMSLHAQVEVESFLSGVEQFVSAHHLGVGADTSRLLLAFAEHLREQQN